MEVLYNTFAQVELDKAIQDKATDAIIMEKIVKGVIAYMKASKEVTAIAIPTKHTSPIINLSGPYKSNMEETLAKYDNDIQGMCLVNVEEKKYSYCNDSIVIANTTRFDTHNEKRKLIWYLLDIQVGDYIADKK